MADFRNVVSVLPCSPTIKASRIFVAVQKTANRPWDDQGVLPGFFIVVVIEPSLLHSRLARNIKKAAACALIGVKKGAIFSLIYFFESFCICYIPHNYVILQAMPHAIPQTHSVFYPHRQ